MQTACADRLASAGFAIHSAHPGTIAGADGVRQDMTRSRSLIHGTGGATSIEYAFIACLIAVAALGSMSAAGNAVGTTLNLTTNQMNAAPGMNPKG